MHRQALTALLLGISAVAAWTGPAHAADRTFTYGLYDKPDFLDAAKMATNVALHPTWLICESLVNLGRDGRGLERGLAESWTSSPDGLVVTMKIRPGVVFHDGTPLDAEAVKASFERHFRPAHNAWSVRGPEPERFLLPLFHSRSLRSDNYTRYSNARLDAVLDEARQQPDGRRRQALYGQAQRLVVDDAPMVFLYHAPRISAVSRRVLGLELTSSTLPYDKLVHVDLAP